MSDYLINQIKRHEGKNSKGTRHFPYRCPAGKLTIGYGRNVEDNGITEGEAMAMLRTDILITEAELKANFPWVNNLDDIRREVLINMCFNIGISRLKGFKKMLAACEIGDFETAAAEMKNSTWYRQVGNRAVELVAQMRTGKYQKAA
jgi:lysozyme